MWDSVVSALQACIFTLGHVTGSLGSGILLTAGALRLALLPLTMRLARRAQAHQRHLQALGPEIATLRSRHAKVPSSMPMRKRSALSKTNCVLLESNKKKILRRLPNSIRNKPRKSFMK